MKKTLLVLTAACALASCQTQEKKEVKPQTNAGSSKVMDEQSSFISIDSANKMISSYINSIDYKHNDSDVQSITYNARDLRKMLDSMVASETVTEVQIKLAHTLSYINDGHANQPAGYNKDALTFVLVGINAQGDYVNAGTAVVDFGRPCPSHCLPGTASNPLIVQ